jgi:muramoyltetrapeptide carboxypeptidase
MPHPLKPRALHPGDSIRILSLASPVDEARVQKGCEEIARLGYVPQLDKPSVLARDGFFSGSTSDRHEALKHAIAETDTHAIFCSRGGYGSNYLLEHLSVALATPKVLLGYSDITSLQIFLWQEYRWVTFYGPMAASGFDHGADSPGGFDSASLHHALTEKRHGWPIDLKCDSLVPGRGEGPLLGGCLTLLEATLATPWELETHGSILILEDRAMKPWQVDRALIHLKQAGKLRGLAGIILGEFPECDAPEGCETVKDVARRILSPLDIPIAWGAPVGHTPRPMLTLPLGVRARILTDESARLEIVEPACS